MFFGSKKTFGIDIEINNFFSDESIGEGKFLIYICNNIYGLDKSYATTFLCILDELQKYSQNLINTTANLENFSAKEIAKCYYCQNYSDIDLSSYNQNLLAETKNLEIWSPESAFDDGSYLIQIDNNKKTRLIAFKSCIQNGSCNILDNSVQQIFLERKEFENLLFKVYSWIKGFSK